MTSIASPISRSRSVDRLIDGLARSSALTLVGVSIVFLLLPLLVTTLMSFDARSYLGPLPPPALSTRWFQRFFSDSYYLRGLQTSLLLAAASVAVSVVAGVSVAVFLDRFNFVGKQAFATLFLSPLVVPPVVIGFALLLFVSRIGIENGFLRLLCGHVVITLPYTIRATVASLAGLDRSLTEAALSLGANERQSFWEITFPLARTGIITGSVFAFAISMDDVAVSMFLTDPNTYTLPVALVSNMRAKFDLTIAAAALMFIGLTVVLMLILDRIVGFNRIIGQGLSRS
jgi:putative spermidine/putrescine transport system permease protein